MWESKLPHYGLCAVATVRWGLATEQHALVENKQDLAPAVKNPRRAPAADPVARKRLAMIGADVGLDKT